MKREIKDLRYGRGEEENRAKIDIEKRVAPAKCAWTSIFTYIWFPERSESPPSFAAFQKVTFKKNSKSRKKLIDVLTVGFAGRCSCRRSSALRT